MSAYVDGELPGTEMLAIRRHLSECAECAREHESTRIVKQAVSRLRSVAPRKDFAAAIMGRLDSEQVNACQRLANWALRFAHGKLSPVAAALAASGVALVLMTAGGIDGITPTGSQSPVAAFGSRAREVAFLGQISAPPLDFGATRPLVLATERPQAGPEIHFAGMTR